MAKRNRFILSYYTREKLKELITYQTIITRTAEIIEVQLWESRKRKSYYGNGFHITSD